MPDSSTFHLRPIQSRDVDPINTLWKTRFGGNATTRQKWINAALDPTRSAEALVAAAADTQAVVGFGILEVGDQDYTRHYLGLDALDLDAPLADRNGLFHMCCVDTEWEGQGVGTALHDQRLQQLRKQDVSRAFGIAWHRSDAVDSRVLFEKHDFDVVATVDQYYKRTTPRPDCPDCDGPCSCSATLYVRRLPID